jgi:hypothetical protein
VHFPRKKEGKGRKKRGEEEEGEGGVKERKQEGGKERGGHTSYPALVMAVDRPLSKPKSSKVWQGGGGVCQSLSQDTLIS